MPDYRRMFQPGGTFFLTLVTDQRRPILQSPENAGLLRTIAADVRAKRPFEFVGAIILPDHLHFVWTLPPGDADFSSRMGMLKAAFTKAFLRGQRPPSVRASRRRHRERDVWQRRFWEHTIRSERDLDTHMDYVHYNPVKHEYVRCPHAWPWSSFHHWVQAGRYPADWMCTCEGRKPKLPDFGDVEGLVGE